MKSMSFTRRAVAGSVVGALALAACSPNDGPMGVRPQLLTSRLALSAPGVAVGGKVAVDLRIEGASEALGAQEGVVYFDPARLRYVGQQQDGTILMVNSKKAAQGEVRIAEADLDGLAPRKAALVFEVVAPQYVGGIRYEAARAATRRSQDEFRRIENGGLLIDPDLQVAADAHVMDLADWKAVAARRDAAKNRAGGVAQRPGQYVLNLQYGDATLDGLVNSTDAIYILGVSAGLFDMITNSDTTIGATTLQRDAVVAGNVRPANTGSATLLPGDEPDGTRVINSTDALAILSFAAALPTATVGTPIPGRGPAATNVVPVTADITTNTTWTKNNIYNLKTRINVRNGATLTIEAGTRIEGDGSACVPGSGAGGTCGNTDGSALFVNRDGRIIAQGTELEPIVMTCSAAVKAKGCWGGLWIAGNAPINSFGTTSAPGGAGTTNPAVAGRTVAGCQQALGEAGAPLYGGCNPNDSSGVVQYVRVEFGGLVTSVANVELNNLTLGGVGRGTVMDHIQVYGGSDDGIEFFGGTVDMKYILVQENGDDQFDFAEGYIGRVQFLITQEDPQDGDKGLEIDNTPSAPFSLNAPWGTYAELWNVTLLGRLDTDPNGASSGNSVNDAIHVRRGYKGSIRNALVYGFKGFARIDNAETCQTDAVSGVRDSLVIRNSYFFHSTLNEVNSTISCQGAPSGSYLSNAATSAGTNTVLTSALETDTAQSPFIPSTNGSRLYRAMERTQPDYRPKPGFTTANAANPVSRNLAVSSSGALSGLIGVLSRPEFFDNTAKYYGAIPPADDAKSTIPWYAGWTRTSNYP